MSSSRLQGRRVMVVEDEALLALDIADMLVSACLIVEGPYGTLDQAIAAAGRVTVDVALLDVNLARQQVWPAAEILLGRGIPVVLMTGYASLSLPRRYAQLAKLDKPVERHAVLSALGVAVTSRCAPFGAVGLNEAELRPTGFKLE